MRELTELEKQQYERFKELLALGRELGGVRIIGDEVHTAGRSWKIPAKSTNNQEQAKCEF